MTSAAKSFIHHVDDRDRELFLRLALGTRRRRTARLCWIAATHIGGAPVAIGIAVAPFFFGALAAVGSDALWILILSHAVVQMVKRTVGRPRPSVHTTGVRLAAEPDQFSFPSGHSAAAMAVAFGYAVAFPHLAAPIILLALVVGASRVMLGVHYPGDVVFGQVLALVTGTMLIVLR